MPGSLKGLGTCLSTLLLAGLPLTVPSQAHAEAAREAFRQITSYACYYGADSMDALLERDASIIQPGTLGQENIRRLRAAQKLVIGYISIGEDDSLRRGDGKGPGGYDSAYFDRDKDGQPDRNSIWHSYFANAAAESWRAHFLQNAAALLQNYRLDGLFLDTVETCLLYPESRPAMVSLIKALRARHPETIIVINRAWDLLPELGDAVDGLMFESFTLSYDFGDKRYIRLRDAGLDAGLDIWKRLLKPARDAHGLVLLALDYSDTPDSADVTDALNRAATLGFVPCFASIHLDRLLHPAHRGASDPRWLLPHETAQSRTLIMSTDRNGFPAGTRVRPDSNFTDYTVVPVVDGRGFGAQRDSLSWRDRAWASGESEGEHSLEFTFPAPLKARSLDIEWARENGRGHPPRSFRIETLASGAAGAWQTVAQIDHNMQNRNRLMLPPAQIIGLRIVQPDGGGSPSRPQLMWIQQIRLIR